MLGAMHAKTHREDSCRASKTTTLTALRVVVVTSGLMQPSHTRLICRAHNRFNPSIALWQHFVQANPSKPRDRRQLSTATPAVQDDTTTDSKHVEPESPSPPEARDPHGSEAETGEVAEEPSAESWTLRKMTTTKGQWLPSKADASIAKNKELRSASPKALLKERGKLLANARSAFRKSKSYTGVIVKPMMNETPIKESTLPWCLNKADRAIPGMQRYTLKPTSRLVVPC